MPSASAETRRRMSDTRAARTHGARVTCATTGRLGEGLITKAAVCATSLQIEREPDMTHGALGTAQISTLWRADRSPAVSGRACTARRFVHDPILC